MTNLFQPGDPGGIGRPYALSPVDRAGALACLKAGHSVAAVARKFNTSRQTIMRERDRTMGLPDYAAFPPAQDPSGLGAHQPGAKLDAGKVRAGLVLGAFAPALWQVARVGTFGANKYSDNGWLSVTDGEARYTDAQVRHDMQHQMGLTHDDESNLLHLAHAAWNALAKLTLFIRNNPGLKL